MQSLGTFKRGDYFSFTMELIDEALETPLTGAAASLACQFRKSADASLIESLVISETATPGTYLFETTDTTDYPLGVILCDVEYTDGDSHVTTSPTMSVTVEGDITHG